MVVEAVEDLVNVNVVAADEDRKKERGTTRKLCSCVIIQAKASKVIKTLPRRRGPPPI